MPRFWYDNWDESFDLAQGGTELSYRRGDIGALLVETEGVRRAMNLANRISSPAVSTRYYVVGDRGYGKSTILNYMAYTLYKNLEEQKTIPVFCSMSGEAEDERSIEFAFFRSLLTSFFDIPVDLEKLGISISGANSISRLRDAELDYKNALIRHGQVSLEFVHTAFKNLLRHLSSDFKRTVFFVDGLDKYAPEIVLRFLRTSQESLNALIGKYNCLFIFAADPTWIQTLDSHEFSGVKGYHINLRGCAADEVDMLIQKRLNQVGIFTRIFREEAIKVLVDNFKGNPRLILQYATILLHYSAKLKNQDVGSGLTKEIVWTEDQKSKLHNRIVEEQDMRYAYEKLRTISSTGNFLKILVAVHGRGVLRRTMDYNERGTIGLTLPDDEFGRGVNKLIDFGCLKLGTTEDFIQLEDDVKEFFRFVEEIGASFEALAVVIDEFEAKIKGGPPPPREDIVIKTAIVELFNLRFRDWLSSEEVAKQLLADPRKERSIRDRFGQETEKKLGNYIPLAIGKLRKEGKLISDEKSKRFRWCSSGLERDLIDVVRSREEIETFEKAMLALKKSELTELTDFCKNTIQETIANLLEFLGQQASNLAFDRQVRILERLGIDVAEPISLEYYFKNLVSKSPQTSDSGKVILDTCRLYLKRIHEKINEIRAEGTESYIPLIRDPPYYLTLKELEKHLRICVMNELGALDPKWWEHRTPKEIRKHCEERKARRENPYPWLEPIEFHPIYYCDFTHYSEIICRRDNFREAFQRIFGDMDAIRVKLKELEPIRNDIGHSRGVTEGAINTLTLYAEHIIRAINNAPERTPQTSEGNKSGSEQP